MAPLWPGRRQFGALIGAPFFMGIELISQDWVLGF
jgi:hypothetical protein